MTQPDRNVRSPLSITLSFTAVLALAFSGFLFTTTPEADALQICLGETTLVNGECKILGDPPEIGPPTCPPPAIDSGVECYVLVDRVPVEFGIGDCPSNTTPDPGGSQCRRQEDWVRLLYCAPSFSLEGNQCVRFIPDVFGQITLTYTLDCVSEGVARLNLGTPVLERGALVSLITLNGSAAVAAEIPGGSSVVVHVTPERLGDLVEVSGPSAAPLCSTEPTSAPESLPQSPPSVPPSTVVQPPPPATPTATVASPKAAPPTAASAPISRPTGVAPADRDTAPTTSAPTTSTIDALPSPTTDTTSAATPMPTLSVPVRPGAPASFPIIPVAECAGEEAVIADKCVPPCRQPHDSNCFGLAADAGLTTTGTLNAGPLATDGLPLLPVAVIAGATLLMSAASVAARTRHQN